METGSAVDGDDGRRVRRRRRRTCVLLVCALGFALLAACSDEAPPDRTLRVMMTDDWVTDPFLAAVSDFERSHPGVRVDVGKTPISHMIDTVTAAIKSGVSPDVVQAHAFSAAAQGLAQQVDDLWAKGKPLATAEFLPGAIDDVTWAGHLYGVPLDTNALFLLYDADQFAAANVPPPGEPFTFASFEAAARALTATDFSKRALAIPTSTWWTYGWIKANGGEVLTVGEDGNAQLSLDDPAVVGALDFLGRLVKEKLAFAPGAADSHSGDALALFRSGIASTLASGSWDVAILEKDSAGDKYRSTLMPVGTAGKSGSVMGGSSMFVPTGSKQRDLAFEFMAHLVSDKYAVRLAKDEGRLPVRTRVYDDPYFERPELQAVIEQLPTASPFKLSAFPEAHNVFAKAVDQVLREGSDAGPVMAEAQKTAQALIPKK
ncbi:MAG: extracellular solute-binding protein [Acidimicrobiales bacterium]